MTKSRLQRGDRLIVALSVVIAVAVSYAALNLGGRVTKDANVKRS
jgi:NO-binding membrane sensor protein with MHYT domain